MKGCGEGFERGREGGGAVAAAGLQGAVRFRDSAWCHETDRDEPKATEFQRYRSRPRPVSWCSSWGVDPEAHVKNATTRLYKTWVNESVKGRVGPSSLVERSRFRCRVQFVIGSCLSLASFPPLLATSRRPPWFSRPVAPLLHGTIWSDGTRHEALQKRPNGAEWVGRDEHSRLGCRVCTSNRAPRRGCQQRAPRQGCDRPRGEAREHCLVSDTAR